MKTHYSPDGPKPIGPYSQATEANGFVFCSGNISMTVDGDFVDGSVAEQTRKALQNMSYVLAGAGLTLADVVKVTVFLIDMNDFNEVNEAYAKMFGDTKPARSCVAVAGLPKNARVEIEAIAQRRPG